MGEVDKSLDLDSKGAESDEAASEGKDLEKAPALRARPGERSNTPTMPWGVDVAPTPLRAAVTAPAVVTAPPVPRGDPATDLGLPPKLRRTLSSAGITAAVRPASVHHDRSSVHHDRSSARHEIVHLSRQARTEPYDLEGLLASHLAWLDEDGKKELFRHLGKGDHGRALQMISGAKENYPKNVSIVRASQIIERAAIARLLGRLGPSHAVGRYDLRAATKETRYIGQLFDGETTLDEALRASKLTRLKTLEIIYDLVAAGSVVLEDMTSAVGPEPGARTSHMRPRVEASLPHWTADGDDSARLTLPDPIETATRAATLRDEIAESARFRTDHARTETPVATQRVAAALTKSLTRLDSDLPAARKGATLPFDFGPSRMATKRFGDLDLDGGATKSSTAKNELPTKRPPPSDHDLGLPIIPAAPKVARNVAFAAEATPAAARREVRRHDPRSDGSEPPPADAVFRQESARADTTDAVVRADPYAGAPTKRPDAPETAAAAARNVATSSTSPVVEAPSPFTQPIRSTRRSGPAWTTVALAGIAVVALIAAVFFATREPAATVVRPSDTPTAARTTSPTIVTPTTTTPAAPTTGAPQPPSLVAVDLLIDATPRFAVVYVDNVLLTGRPVHRQIARDDLEHEVRIEAPGYKPLKTKFSARGDIHLILALEPLPKLVLPPPTATATAPVSDDGPYN